jgi:hypothetical protein
VRASLHTDFVNAIAHLAMARKAFKGLVENNLVLGNDNHIGDVGEYWVRRYYELKGQFESYGPGKNGPFDIRLKNGKCVSVKTTSEWNESGYGSRVCADGEDWTILAAVLLDKNLYPEKLAIVPLHRLIQQEVFSKNVARRTRADKPTSTHPRFKWWAWLDDYLVRLKIRNKDMKLLP